MNGQSYAINRKQIHPNDVSIQKGLNLFTSMLRFIRPSLRDLANIQIAYSTIWSSLWDLVYTDCLFLSDLVINLINETARVKDGSGKPTAA
jgi:hypothetical protein